MFLEENERECNGEGAEVLNEGEEGCGDDGAEEGW